MDTEEKVKCRKCGRVIVQLSVRTPSGVFKYWTSNTGGRLQQQRGGWWHWSVDPCYHEPQTEVDIAKEILKSYGMNVENSPQKKNPWVEKPRPWDRKWQRKNRFN